MPPTCSQEGCLKSSLFFILKLSYSCLWVSAKHKHWTKKFLLILIRVVFIYFHSFPKGPTETDCIAHHHKPQPLPSKVPTEASCALPLVACQVFTKHLQISPGSELCSLGVEFHSYSFSVWYLGFVIGSYWFGILGIIKPFDGNPFCSLLFLFCNVLSKSVCHIKENHRIENRHRAL